MTIPGGEVLSWEEIKVRARIAGIWAVLAAMGVAAQLLSIGWPPKGWTLILSMALGVFVSKATHPERAVSLTGPEKLMAVPPEKR